MPVCWRIFPCVTTSASPTQQPRDDPGRRAIRVAASARRRRRRLLRTAAWALCLLAGSVLAGASAYVSKPAWSATLVQQSPEGFVFPGAAPRLPWPAAGQAALAVDGVGGLGTSGAVGSPVPIASVAKIMTAYQVLSDHPLAAGESGPALTVLPAEAALYGEQVAHDESVVAVNPGEQLTERQALEALMLASADNVAQMLARWDAGSVPAFLDKLNRAAVRLGIRHTLYTDPSGLDPATVSTAPDQLVLARVTIRDPAFAELVGEKNAVIPVAGPVHNFNRLLGQDGVVGVKTGSTRAAGGCLVFAADVAPGTGVPAARVYGVVLGQPGTPGTILPHALSAAQQLVTAAGAALETATVVPRGRSVALVRQPLHSDRRFGPAGDVRVVGWPGLVFSVRVSGTPGAPALTVSAVGDPGNTVTARLTETRGAGPAGA